MTPSFLKFLSKYYYYLNLKFKLNQELEGTEQRDFLTINTYMNSGC